MMIEDRFLDVFKRAAYHPSSYIYAWKRKDLEKLFEEVMMSNVAIIKGEVWLLEKDQTISVIPLKSGQMKVFFWEMKQAKKEEWFDFVDRSAKESLQLINSWELEKSVRVDKRNRIWYHFTFAEG